MFKPIDKEAQAAIAVLYKEVFPSTTKGCPLCCNGGTQGG